jgi:hypothetical protein
MKNILTLKCENCNGQIEVVELATACGTPIVRVVARNSSILEANGFRGALTVKTEEEEGVINSNVKKFLSEIGKERLGVHFDECIPGLARRVAEGIKRPKPTKQS